MVDGLFNRCLSNLEGDCLREIETHSRTRKFAADEFVVRQGQMIVSLPIVLSGRIKVFSTEESVRFLLYYLEAGEACIFSFANISTGEPMEFSAIAEVDSEILLLPINEVNRWINRFPSFGNMLLKGYQKHYKDLLHTTKQIICYNLEERLLGYLRTKARIEKSDLLKISHQQIADDLGTSREVISRLLKKMGLDHKVAQVGRKIKVL